MSVDRDQFASDNYSGLCPEALEYLMQANQGYEPAYGEDRWTRKACDMFREIFETDCEVYFVFNGTAANSLALSSLCRPYNSIVCHELAHMETDECGAPEFFTNGAKILVGGGADGKLEPETVERIATRRSDIHYPKPSALSLTQATELGTVYTADELGAVCETGRKHGMRVHMDGARFANALVSLGESPKDLTWRCGVDVLCLGGTKNGLAVGDAVIFFDRTLAADFDYRCKQAGQLASKMRFLAAPWVGLLRNDVWLRNASRANRCAALLEERVRDLPGVRIMFPRQANSLFLDLPRDAVTAMRRRGWRFYTFIGAGGVRLMCSWCCEEEAAEELAEDLRQVLREIA
jgi:threonine aldolase